MPEHHPDQPRFLNPGSPQATPSTLTSTKTCQDADSPKVESLDGITRKAAGEDKSGDINEGDRLVPSASESEEYDDSGDESFTPNSEVADSDVESLSTASSSNGHQEEEDISNFLFEGDLRARVTEIINTDSCEKHCVQGKVRELEHLLTSLNQMTKSERMKSLYTLLALFMIAPTAERKRGKGEREKFL
ncbi:hypothetical protein F442_08910 [Phytophthora nicotianae P10297]|uniref:Uncharacterized protein n=1 Tax=Phytophthora nicotianae P10297 TaxID=1317064 RepID=W2ZE77_PHYNI|nr:hypothetical protein F442_08910 [Phytophthora nicotianae P10297]